jgi:hypothetical protein
MPEKGSKAAVRRRHSFWTAEAATPVPPLRRRSLPLPLSASWYLTRPGSAMASASGDAPSGQGKGRLHSPRGGLCRSRRPARQGTAFRADRQLLTPELFRWDSIFVGWRLELQICLRVFRWQRKIGKPVALHPGFAGIGDNVGVIRINGARSLDGGDSDNLPVKLDL